MPVGWVPLQKSPVEPPLPIDVYWKVQSYDNTTGVWTYDQGVVAKYDVETLTAEHLELHLAQQYGVARGSVHLIDPDGTMDADDMTFSWDKDKKYIVGSNVLVKIAGATIRARHADLRPGEWTLSDYYFTTDRLKPPLYSVNGSSITIYPGRYAKLRSSALDIFGYHIYGLPEETINLDPRATGFRYPNLEFRGGAGVGVNWISGFLIDKQSTLELHADSYPGSFPGDGAVLTRSFTNPDQVTRIIQPRSEFGQRFSYGYFESVLTPSPESEEGYLGSPRSSVSFETSQNNGVSGRGKIDEDFTLPAALEFEQGGNYHGFDMLNDERIEDIEPAGGHGVARASVASSVDLPSLKLSRDIEYVTRLDASLFYGNHAFGWGKVTTGLVYKPVSWLQFGLGGTASIQGGTPDLDIDPLYSLNGIAARVDYLLGPRKISYMQRYDAHLGWYDQEWQITQDMGSLQAYYIYRRYPGDSRYGVTLRIDQFQNLLKQRSFKRSASATQSTAAAP